MENEHYPFYNTPLPYDYNALEPYIDEKTMHLHHDKHLQTYINNLNKILKENPELQKYSLKQLITNASRFSKEIGTGVQNNAGGVYNHRFYFSGLINDPDNTISNSGELGDAILQSFSSFEKFNKELKKSALSVFGSGYAWLVCTTNGKVRIITTPNQNSTLPLNLIPIIAVDVWEHAYYLKHFNDRGGYLDNLEKIINWDMAEYNYINCPRARNNNC